MSFVKIEHLTVKRILSNGQTVNAGQLASSSSDQIYFSYDKTYLNADYGALSPLKVPAISELIEGPYSPNEGLHGIFADSLPDGWGRLLMDRAFRHRGILPQNISMLSRLAFVGQTGSGALIYEPAYELNQAEEIEDFEIITKLAQEAELTIEGETDEVFLDLIQSGSSAGARPKSNLFVSEDFSRCSIHPFEGCHAWMVKFTTQITQLGHDEGLCEAIFMEMAKNAGIKVAESRLFKGRVGPGRPTQPYYFGTERFDRTPKGRLHMASAAGLLDANFREPVLDTDLLIRLTSYLTHNCQDIEELIRRTLFNWLACNQDDHAKNWAYLQTDDGQWHLSPAYDLTFSLGFNQEHSTSFAGCGKELTDDAIRSVLKTASMTRSDFNRIASEVIEAIHGKNGFMALAEQYGIQPKNRSAIAETLKTIRDQHRHLW